MLSLSPVLEYVHEPFNAHSSHDLFPGSFDLWYYYLDERAYRERISALRRVVDLQYPILHHLAKSHSLREAGHHVKAALRFAWKRWRGHSVLWKDPLALLSAERLAKVFDLQVIVMIRHPAAFAGSLKKKDWTFPFKDLLAQDRLMEEKLAPYTEEIEEFAWEKRSVVEQAALLWSILYDIVTRYRQRHPSWLFLRHEDVARAPLETFSSLYADLGLAFTESIQETVLAHSRSPEEKEAEGICRDSESVIYNWKERLTQDEVRLVRDRTTPVAEHFYNESDW